MIKDVELYNLTSPQQSIWLTEQFYKGSSINIISGSVTINQKVNFDILEKAINIYVQNNDATRIQLTLINNEIKQYFVKYDYFTIPLKKVKDVKQFNHWSSSIAKIPLDIIENPLFDFQFFRFPDGHGGFQATKHHIVSDAWSMSLMVNLIIENYRRLIKADSIENEQNFSYINYINSDTEYLNSNKYYKDKEYWNNIFREPPVAVDIGSPNPSAQSISAKRFAQSFSKYLCKKIFAFCKDQHISVYCFLMSVYMFYLHKVTSIDNITIGTPILNRTNFAEKNTIGMYINTNVFTANVDTNLTFSEFCTKVSKEQFGLIRHQKYPFLDLQNDLKQKNDINKRLYNIAFSYQNAKTDHSNEDIEYFIQWCFNGCLADLLQIHAFDMNDTGIINIYYDYNISALTQDELKFMHARIEKIITQAISDPKILLKNIDIIAEEENKLLDRFNRTDTHLLDTTIIDLISNPKYRCNNAIFYNNKTITYKELLEKSDTLAKFLILSGVHSGDNIGLLFRDKNIDLIISALAVLKAGGCFLSLYPEYPNNRLKYMLEDSNCKLLITDDFDRIDLKIKKIDINDLKEMPKDISFPKLKSTDNAYIIYTSGSTGTPKGSILTHKNLVNFVYSFYNRYSKNIKSNDRFISITNVCFDVSICEIFVPLFFGASLYLYKDTHNSNIIELCKYINDNKITFAYFPPSLLEDIALELERIKNTSLDKLLVGVEPIRYKTLLLFYNINPEMKIVNGYGPSETTICSTMYNLKNNINTKEHIVPIGSPIENTKIYILDKNQKKVPINVAGEIYITGAGVGNGYINRDELNLERFVTLSDGQRAYKTGDIAKWLPDGNIMFAGRQDNQIKFRGYRIDLGEIESNIIKYEGVKTAVVLLNNDKLIAYVCLNDISIAEQELRKFLSVFLPYYMIPSSFIFVDSLPLTHNGKIDRDALLEMKGNIETDLIQPNTKIEKILFETWRDVLGIDEFGIHSNFFDLGGDSLHAMKCVAILLGKNIIINTQDLYDYPTIKMLSDKINDTKKILKNEHTYIESVDICRKKINLDKGDILLTGSTGFLGSHILYELIKKTDKKIYCIIRERSNTATQNRLKERLSYYFKDELDKYFGDRIIVVRGDFSKASFDLDEKDYEMIKTNVKTIINSAALVKHYGTSTEFSNSNINSVKNLIDFCLEHDVHLVHISTVSVSGSKLMSKNEASFSETDLYIGQNIDNPYVRTKFEAEQLIINGNKNGLISTIFRVGNIMWRSSDGIFQSNEHENAFLNRLKSIINIKVIPKEMLKTKIDLTPVDLCSEAIIRILLEKNVKTIYHIYNSNIITINRIVSYLKKLGLDIKIVDIDSYKLIINDFVKNNYDLVQGLINDLSDISIYNSSITIKQQSTNAVLERISFRWTGITDNYLNKKIGGLYEEKGKKY